METKIEWLKYVKNRCVLKMEGYDDLYSSSYSVLNKEAEKRLIGKIVIPKLPKKETYLPSWLYSHKCRCEIMDTGKHKGHFVVRSLKDRSKYWHLSPTDLVVIDEPQYKQQTLF